MFYEEKDLVISELSADYERLWHQVVHLTHIDDIFWQIVAIFSAHPELRKSEHSTFENWMLSCYVSTMLVGLRTLVDLDARALSLLKLLRQMEENCHTFSRERHQRLCGNTDRATVDDWFDVLAGVGEDHVPQRVFHRYKKLLEKETKLLRPLADKNVAHLDRKPATVKPTTDHVRSALLAARYVLEKCLFILKGDALISSVPAIQDDWLEVFRFAWLPTETDAPAHKHLDDLYGEYKKTVENPRSPSSKLVREEKKTNGRSKGG